MEPDPAIGPLAGVSVGWALPIGMTPLATADGPPARGDAAGSAADDEAGADSDGEAAGAKTWVTSSPAPTATRTTTSARPPIVIQIGWLD